MGPVTPSGSCSACIRESSADKDQILNRDSRDRKRPMYGPNAVLKGSSRALSEHSRGGKRPTDRVNNRVCNKNVLELLIFSILFEADVSSRMWH